MRKVTWRSWMLLGTGLSAYAALGWLWSGDGTVEAWLYRIGLTAAAVLPLLFAAVYTATRARWWRNEIGSSLVLAAIALIPTTAPLAYVFWFNGGILHSSWLAWLEVSGPALSALALARMCWVWLQLNRTRRVAGDDGKGRRGQVTMPAHTHVEREDEPWAVEIQDHPGRTESEGFRRSKVTAHKILAAVREQDPDGTLAFLAGPAEAHPQAHHAGSLWVFDGSGWFQVLNVAGVEWAAQWSADASKIDALRQNAQRLYVRFPETLDELAELGYPEARAILSEPVTNAAGVARWTDSLFNATVMLSAGLHSGVVGTGQTGGWHRYPKSIWDMQATKRDDFTLWVTAGEGITAVVAPVAPHGSGDGRVSVLYAEPGSELHRQQQEAHAKGEPHILEAGHPLAVQAFKGQEEA